MENTMFVNPHKHLREQFVSNLTGSSMLEIVSLSVIVPALIILRQWSGFYTAKGDNQSWKKYMVSLSVDYMLTVLPILAFFTALSDKVFICTIVLVVLVIFMLLTRRSLPSTPCQQVNQNASLRASVSSYRVAMMIVTCLCILAVDFKIFPRRYAKAETYGTGLMDLGVGSFVVANALVSRQARNVMPTTWKSAVQSTVPLLCLGIFRLISTRSVDYQVHVGEYGVHWNFFLTLAAVSILTSLINIHPKYCGIFAISILIVYQICLLCGLNEYLISNNRTSSIVSQNKEGLFSIFGYWGMYLAGVYLGNKILFSSKKSTMAVARTRVWVLTILFWLSTLLLDKHVERVSRRMCNLAYVAFVFAQNFQVWAILMLSDLISGRRRLVLEEAFDCNLLGSFLAANLLTGVVNLSRDTLSASSVEGFCILLGYSAILSALVGLARFNHIKLKFW